MKKVLFAAVGLFAASLALLGVGLYDRSRVVNVITHRNCIEIEQLKTSIREQIEQSIQNLPKIAYYRDHPDELQLQQNDQAQAIDRFRPLHCP